MNDDGSDVRRLTFAPHSGYSVWSPDGRRIAFHSNRQPSYPGWDIYVMNADGSDQTRLTFAEGADTSPSWSPDGQKIAYNSERDGHYQIYTMGPDGSHQERLTNGPDLDTMPQWSPDGRRIAFLRGVPDSWANDVCIMDADGSHIATVAHRAWGWRGGPAWSPDSQRLAFSVLGDQPNPGSQIYIVNADGSGLSWLPSVRYDVGWPAWSPDGSRLAVTIMGQWNRFDIYLIDPVDGTEECRLTDWGCYTTTPFWCPVPTNRAPQAVALANGVDAATVVATSAAGAEVNLDGSQSSDPDGDPLTYAWDLSGDGSYATPGETITHLFPIGGPSVVSLRVTDPSGLSDTDTASVTVHYGFAGLLPPYAVPPRAFRIGSSIPLKWQHSYAGGAVADSSAANPTVEIRLVSTDGTEGEPILVSDPGASGLRYEIDTNTWHYNWKTRDLAAGTYSIRILCGQSGQADGPFAIALGK